MLKDQWPMPPDDIAPTNNRELLDAVLEPVVAGQAQREVVPTNLLPFVLGPSLDRFEDLREVTWGRRRPDVFEAMLEQVRWSPDLELFTRGNDLLIRTHVSRALARDLVVLWDDGVLCIVTGGSSEFDGELDAQGHGAIRRLTLPADVRPEDIRATFGEGILEVSFPIGRSD